MKRILRQSLSAILAIAGTYAAAGAQSPRTATLESPQWRIRIEPATLGVWGRLPGASGEMLLAAPAPAMEIAEFDVGREQASWRIPAKRMRVEARLSADGLSVRFTTDQEQTLAWPLTGTDEQTRALIWPESEGLYLPTKDPFWLNRPPEYCRDASDSAMPFWGAELPAATIAYLLPDELRCQLCLEKTQGRLTLRATHEFLRRDGFPPYEVRIALAPETPIGPALVYRELLRRSGRHVPFADKVRRAPEAAKLAGAMHAYLWGDGRTKAAIDQLRALGVDRAALFYDQDPRTHKTLVGAETIAAARAHGYVIGPYDTWSNVQAPKTAESFSSIYDEQLHRTGGVMKPDGSRLTGFGGQGYYLSSEALKRTARPFIAERVEAHLRTGVNGYFLDVDGSGSLFDDFDPQHPMTVARDRDNRLERMRFLSEEKQLVLGSESVAAWSSAVVHFSHGSLTPKGMLLWNLLRNRNLVGGWWPPERPRNFFQAIDAPSDFATATFDPRYRLPLYETVFHDSLISTDHWSLPLMKFRNLVQTRTLLLLLYNAPAIWHLDQRALREDGPRYRALHAFFAPLHRRIADAPLVQFAWLTEDRLVQRAQFGDEVAMTANFTARSFGAIPPRCIEAHWLREDRKESFCPAP